MTTQPDSHPNANGSMEGSIMTLNMTTSRTGSFYLAYGSNLSARQMALRLCSDASSSVPIALARLDAHAWIICGRGYANVVALPRTDAADQDTNVVWGLLYNLSTADEAMLDRYEGHNMQRNPDPTVNPDIEWQTSIPFLQGPWDYNKHYLPVTVTRWLVDDPNQFGTELVSGLSGGGGDGDHGSTSAAAPITVRALVYVDEFRTTPGKINYEYIGRMNRAIRESVKLGLPQRWVDRVMRQYIPIDVEVDDEDYVGTADGYDEAESTETADQVRERVLMRRRQPQQSRSPDNHRARTTNDC